MRKRNNKMKWCKFPRDLWRQNKGLAVLSFQIYHVWIWRKIRTSLTTTWLIYGTKAFMLTIPMTLNPEIFQIRYHSRKMVTVRDWKELFSRGDQHVYTTTMRLSKIYHREEVMKMTKWDIFRILFPVEYLKEILITKTNNLLKRPMDPGEFILWLGCWF